MWWIYLIGAIVMFTLMFVLLPHSSDWIIGLIAGIWLLNSTRVAYREDQQRPKG